MMLNKRGNSSKRYYSLQRLERLFYFLVKITGVTLVLVLPTGCAYTTIYGQYLNYDCSPVANEQVSIIYSVRDNLFFTHSEIKTISSDEKGFFSAMIHGYSIEVIPGAVVLSNDRFATHGAISFSSSEYYQLQSEMNKNNPVILYAPPKKEWKGLVHGHNQYYQEVTDSFPMHRGENKDVLSLAFPSGLNFQALKVGLKSIVDMGDESSHWEIEISAVDGGIISVPIEDLPFSAEIPTEGYMDSIVYEISEKEMDNTLLEKAYYIKADNGAYYGTVMLHLSIGPSPRMDEDSMLYLVASEGVPRYMMGFNVILDYIKKPFQGYGIQSDGTKIQSPYLPPEECGGAMSKGSNGTYFVKPKRAGIKGKMVTKVLKSKDSAYELIQKAKQQDTPLEWLLASEHLANPWVVSSMLNRSKVPLELETAILDYYLPLHNLAFNSKDKAVLHQKADALMLPYESYLKLIDSILRKMAGLNGLSHEGYSRFIKLEFESDSWNVLSYNKSTPADLLLKIAKKEAKSTPGLYTKKDGFLLMNPNLPAKAIEILLSSNEGYFVPMWVASHVNTPPYLLEEMSRKDYGHRNVNKFIAKNLNTPPNTLAYLAKKGDEELYLPIVGNPNTLPETLDFLVQGDAEEHTKAANINYRIATNPNTPVSALVKLAQNDNDSKSGLLGVICNLKTPLYIKNQIVKSNPAYYSRYMDDDKNDSCSMYRKHFSRVGY